MRAQTHTQTYIAAILAENGKTTFECVELKSFHLQFASSDSHLQVSDLFAVQSVTALSLNAVMTWQASLYVVFITLRRPRNVSY